MLLRYSMLMVRSLEVKRKFLQSADYIKLY